VVGFPAQRLHSGGERFRVLRFQCCVVAAQRKALPQPSGKSVRPAKETARVLQEKAQVF
jgi:hypothetical protein